MCFFQEKEDCIVCTVCSKALVHFCKYFNEAHHGHAEDDDRDSHSSNPADSDSSSSSDDLRRFPTVSDVASLRGAHV